MAWSGIKFDKYYRIPGGVGINEYFLKSHGYTVPGKRTENLQGITISSVPVYLTETGEKGADLAIQNIKALNANGQLPHFIVTRHSVWQLLDMDDCWQRSDGRTNRNTICVAITMDDGLISWQYKITATDHAAMLVAYLLKKYRLPDSAIFITRECPEFFKDRWKDFKAKMLTQLKKL